MGFLDKLADLLAPSAPSAAVQSPPQQTTPPPPAEPAPPPVPAVLPGISARTAAEICKECKPELEPSILKLLTPQQTPAQFLGVLQEKHLGADMVKVLAQGLPDREGVAWAVRCAQKVAGTLPPADVAAMKAAQAWIGSPSPETQAEAAAAAERTDRQGPGAWAAQGAAWAQPATPPEGPPPARLTPQAVSASVLLASTILARPEFAVRNLAAPQMPAMAAPGMPAAPGVSVPQIPGAAGQLQAGLAAPALGGAMSAPSVGTPAMPGITAAGSALPAVQAPGVAIPGQPGLPQFNVPQVAPPVMPPAVLAFMFKEQQPFIAIGLDIASGRMPVA